MPAEKPQKPAARPPAPVPAPKPAAPRPAAPPPAAARPPAPRPAAPPKPAAAPAPAAAAPPKPKKRPEDTLYPELRNHAWFRKLLVYPVINDMERKLQGDYLFESPAFMRLLATRAFRETCLNDPEFRKVLLTEEFKDFLARLTRGRILNGLVRALGWILGLAICAGCLYLAFYFPLLEKVPSLQPWVEKGANFLHMTSQATFLTGMLVTLGVFLGSMLGGTWDWALRRRFGPCSSCGQFGFGRKFPPRFCKACGEWIEYLN